MKASTHESPFDDMKGAAILNKPVRYDFDIYSERTLRKRWTLRNPRREDGSLGDPMDITGWHARLVVPAGPEDDFIFITDEDDNFPEGGLITMGGSEGWFEWLIPDEVTSVLDFESETRRDYFFDLQYPNGDWVPYLRGICRLWRVRELVA